jgi:hypothetical protein
MSLGRAAAAVTPTMRLAVETIPSLAPRIAARNQPILSTRCLSLCNGIRGPDLSALLQGRKVERVNTVNNRFWRQAVFR